MLVRAAVEVAEHFGLTVAEPVLIQETNNTVLWLTPGEVIAKATEPRSRRSAAWSPATAALSVGHGGVEVGRVGEEGVERLGLGAQ